MSRLNAALTSSGIRFINFVTSSAGVHTFPHCIFRFDACPERELARHHPHHPNTYANISGATIEASDSITWLGVSTPSFPHVIFSFGTAPEYDPKLVVESLIWQK